MVAPPFEHIRHFSAVGDWEMATRAPVPALRPFVKNYTWYIDRAPIISRRLQVPHSGIVLIISLGTPMRVIDPRDAATTTALLGTYVAGLFETGVFTEYVGTTEGIEVRLTPLGAQRLLGVEMDSVANRVVELRDILGASARQFEEQLCDTPDCAARLDLVEAFILRRLVATEAAPPVVRWAWREIHAAGGNADIGAIAEASGQTHRQLIAAFRGHIGLPPKRVARIVRFERAVARLDARAGQANGRTLAEVALDGGYYDQAHFNREFRALAGIAPGEYLARQLPEGGGVSGME